MSIVTEIESLLGGVESQVQQAIAPMLPWAQGVYQLVKSDAEAALKAAGSEIETMAVADFHALLGQVQNAVQDAAKNTSMSGPDKFSLVFNSIMDGVKAGFYPTIKVIGVAALNALINTAYCGLPAILAAA